jgi:hypothetical protein
MCDSSGILNFIITDLNDEKTIDFNKYIEKFASDFKDLIIDANKRRNMKYTSKNKKITPFNRSIFNYIFKKDLYHDFSLGMQKINDCIDQHYKDEFNAFKSRPDFTSNVNVTFCITFDFELLSSDQKVENYYSVSLPKSFIFEKNPARIEDFFYYLKRENHVVIEKFADSKVTEMTHCITNVLESSSSARMTASLESSNPRIPIGFLLREEENKFCVIQFNREISNVFYGMSHMEFYYGRVCSNKDKINRITAGFFEKNARIDIDLYALKEEEDDDKKYNKNLLTPKVFTIEFNESNDETNKEYLTKLLLFLRKIQENIGSAGVKLAADVDTNLFKSIERMSMLEADLIEYLR